MGEATAPANVAVADDVAFLAHGMRLAEAAAQCSEIDDPVVHRPGERMLGEVLVGPCDARTDDLPVIVDPVTRCS